MEAESACLNNMQDFLQPKCSSSLAIDIEAHKHEERVKLGGMLMHENEAEGMMQFILPSPVLLVSISFYLTNSLYRK